MKLVNNPPRKEWQQLCLRPIIPNKNIEPLVQEILENIKKNGDQALLEYSKKFDHVELDNIVVNTNEIEQAIEQTPIELQNAINNAYENINKFHLNQKNTEPLVEITHGITCWRKNVAIEKVGLYIPGGTAPLFSTILMLGIPAKIAGCKEIILCTPPNKEGKINPAILYTAKKIGVTQIFKVGGAQAIAAMSYGTKTIPPVYKIFGPGNQYVTKAKSIVQQQGIAIDMPAGPSEVLIIADDASNPAYIAADLLSQAEHGIDSQVVLTCNSLEIIEKVKSQIQIQIEKLPRKEIAIKALEQSLIIYFSTLEDCLNFSNQYAPEHLIIATQNTHKLANEVINAGSVFLGNYSCESAGDYASGTNHTLPTNSFARNYSGVSLDSFYKKITFQELTREGLISIAQTIETMAEAEGLIAHKNAVSIRLKD